MNLDKIGIKYDTDKSSVDHNYLNFYEVFFSPLRNSKITLLEIGVEEGKSLQVWNDYFQLGTIVGLDVWNAFHSKGRINIRIGDQSESAFLKKIAKEFGPFDIIIDDGSHKTIHHKISLFTLFQHLKGGGYYIIEDLEVAPETAFDMGALATYLMNNEHLPEILLRSSPPSEEEINDYVVLSKIVDFVISYRQCVILRKKEK